MPDLHASTPPLSTSATEPALARLYAAAVGPVNVAYYLAVFDRFEALGRWRSSWNWAAAALTLNWLLFRQLWLAALVYGSILLLLPLLVLGLGRHLFALPSSIELGLWLSFLLLSVVVPGLWGNAVLYVHSQRCINRALTASATLDQACALLLRRASGRKHTIGLLMVNALLVGLALSAYVGWHGVTADTPDVAVSGVVLSEPTAAASSVQPASAAASAVSKPATASVPASTSAPASASASAPASASVVPSAAAIGRLVTASASASSVVATGVATRAPASFAAPAVQVSAPAGVASIARGGRTTGLSAYAGASWATSGSSAPASAAVSTTAVAASRPLAGRVFVNVGLFAQADNAQQVHARLVADGLPALSDQISNAQGQHRTRVRVGPFASRAQGQAAVVQIKALKLDAVLAP